MLQKKQTNNLYCRKITLMKRGQDKMKNYTIYNDDICAYIDENKNCIIESLKEIDLTINDENIFCEASTMIDNDADYLKDLIISYDRKTNYNKILVVADFGLWYGRRKVTKYFKSLYDAFYRCVQDTNKVYFYRKNTTMLLNAIHHDGCNYFKFYKIINNKKYAISFDDFCN